MKRLFIFVLLVSAGFISRPASAFFDGEIFGGRNFAGKMDGLDNSIDLKGWNYGARAHLNTSGLFYTAGLGLYAEGASLKSDTSGVSLNLKKYNAGPDMYFRVDILPVVKPYARVGFSAFEYDNHDFESSKRKSFNSCYYGAGLAFEAPIPVIRLMLFAEYLNNRRFYGESLTLHTVNVGVSAGI